MMSMLNQAAVEALCSATYLENYLDCMENLPDDLQRVVSQLRELDSHTNEVLKDIITQKDAYVRQDDGVQKKRALISIQRGLIRSQELGDEKLQLVSQILEHIENRTRQLEQDLENLDPGAAGLPSTLMTIKEEEPHKATSTTSTNASSTHVKAKNHQEEKSSDHNKIKRQRRQRTHAESMAKEEDKRHDDEERPKKKKKRKTKRDKAGGVMPSDKSAVDAPIDPDEPTYCLCDRVSYGEMIGCDNDSCAIEWFHFDCIQLSHKPKGKWYCPNCRGDKPSVMRSDIARSK
ncbi:hypothetical protein CAPTEDRAFT_225717 [Capitella teleta]|uniref:Inhibitor of growth protein n=1 Tax=Capitella teleta TaxID=283909 RepID=R7UZQ7_CAPTE|nr:hypothetical protein CAPTEDRAFT_225717 [Capitella teleta]|eukprot:ELU08926.1 hypothetical protein CAPTEDRAFT_225717 [Capitella teleta]